MDVNLALVPQGKSCGKCGAVKPMTAFNRNRTQRDGLQAWCRDCHTPHVRRTQLQRAYGITPEDYDEMYQAQGGCCVICGDHQSTLTAILHVDHNHETGKVRGLLCRFCNLLEGFIKDKPQALDRLRDYKANDGYTLEELRALRDRGYFNPPREEHSRASKG